MVGISGNGNGGKYYYCKCSTSLKKNAIKKTIKKETLEKIVFEDALKLINDHYLERIAKLAYKEILKHNKGLDTKSIDEEIKSIELNKNRVLSLLDHGVEASSIASRIQET